MPVELRKRPAAKELSPPEPKRLSSKPRSAAETTAKATSKVKQAVGKVKTAVTGESADAETETNASAVNPVAADTVTKPEAVDDDTGKVQKTTTKARARGSEKDAVPKSSVKETESNSKKSKTGEEASTPLSSDSANKRLPASALSTPTTTHTGQAAPLSSLLSASDRGIIVFTYPKASTPGCTTQACLFRDNYSDLQSQGYEVYGLSNDSEKANTTFKTKQNLPYTMLCDPAASLTAVLGMKKPGPAKGTLRGVVVLGKSGDGGDGTVELWFQGGPAKTVDAVREFLGLT